MRGARMRGRVVMVVAALTGAALVATAGAAQAAPILKVSGGATTTVSTPEIGKAMLNGGIVPLPVGGAKLEKLDLNTLSTTVKLPITGGTLDQGAFFAGDATHKGGLQFINLLAFRSVTVSDFKVYVDFADPRLEATVNNDPKQKVKLFKVDISGVQFGGDGVKELQLNNNKLVLSAEGAALLNAKLRTKVFAEGAVFGTANSTFLYTVAP